MKRLILLLTALFATSAALANPAQSAAPGTVTIMSDYPCPRC